MEIHQNVMEEKSIEGEWWLPQCTNIKIKGVLTISEGSINLVLDLLLEDSADLPYEKLIFGESKSGELLTLQNSIVFYRGKVFKYNVGRVIEGAHYPDDVFFNKCTFHLPELVSWFRIKTFDLGCNSLEYDLELPDIKLFTDDHKRRFVQFGNQYHIKRNSAHFYSLSSYVCQSTIGLTIDDIVEELNDIQYIYSLILLKSIHCSKIWLNEGTRLHINNITNRKFYEKRVDIPFIEYKHIKDSLPQLFNSYFSRREAFRIIVSLIYTETSRTGKDFNENNFLNIVRAMEVFHRTSFNKGDVTEDHMKRLREIYDGVNSEHLNWLKSKLAYSHEPTLLDRLYDIIHNSNIQFFKKTIPDYESLLKDIKNSRNYYTHYDKKGKRKAKTGEELYRIYHLSKFIIIAVLLEHLGVESKTLDKTLELKSYNFFFYFK